MFKWIELISGLIWMCFGKVRMKPSEMSQDSVESHACAPTFGAVVFTDCARSSVG